MTAPNLARELHEAETLESALTQVFAMLEPPQGAKQRLLAVLEADGFHESQLTLDAGEPYSFEEALIAQQYVGTDLLAAGLEEEPIDEDEFDDEEA